MMTQKSPKISKNNVNSIYDQTCSECNDEVIDQLRQKMKMMTNDDTKISKITKNCLVFFQGLVASQEPRPSERTYSTDLFNPFCWTVWMAATTPPCLKINVLYRTDCVYHTET